MNFEIKMNAVMACGLDRAASPFVIAGTGEFHSMHPADADAKNTCCDI